MLQPAPGQFYQAPQIRVNEEPLKQTSVLPTGLALDLSRNAKIDIEVNTRLSQASSVYDRLRVKVWERRRISHASKLMAVVLTIVLCLRVLDCVYSRHARQLNHFHMKCLRKLLSIKWQDMVPDTEVLTRGGIPNIHKLLQEAQVRWAGHVARMPDNRLPIQLLY